VAFFATKQLGLFCGHDLHCKHLGRNSAESAIGVNSYQRVTTHCWIDTKRMKRLSICSLRKN